MACFVPPCGLLRQDDMETVSISRQRNTRPRTVGGSDGEGGNHRIDYGGDGLVPSLESKPTEESRVKTGGDIIECLFCFGSRNINGVGTKQVLEEPAVEDVRIQCQEGAAAMILFVGRLVVQRRI